MALFLAVPLVFLALYVFRYAAPLSAAIPHIGLLLLAWGAVAALRIAICRLIPISRVAALVNTVLIAISLLALIIYYVAVVLSLEAWGRVISWPLITTYATQFTQLAEVLNIPASLAWGCLSGLVLIACYGIHGLTRKRRNWAAEVAVKGSVPLVLILTLSVLGGVSARLYAFSAYPASAQKEPISLTLFPEDAFKPLQTHSSEGSSFLDRIEDEARRRYVPNPDAMRRNVFIIVGDALRPDHMSVNGYQRITTPYLDSLEKEAKLRRIPGMTAACAESSCGLMAITQSKYVHQLTPRAITLFEVLRLHGYEVRLTMSGDHTNFYGLRQAYGEVDSYFDGSMARGFYMNDDELVLDHVRSMDDWNGRPVMMQFHMMSSHGLGKRHEAFQRYEPWLNYYRPGAKELARNSSSRRSEAVNFYDNGVLQFDEMVRQLIGALGEKGYLKDALVVITADHGEMLGEYGEFSHSKTVHEAAIHVPFLVVDFGNHSHKTFTAGAASQVDIAPTILAELGMPMPDTWAGRPLQSTFERDFVYFQQGSQIGLFDFRDPEKKYKYWIDYRTSEEFAFRLSPSMNEEINEIGEVDPVLRRGWRLSVANSGASAPGGGDLL